MDTCTWNRTPVTNRDWLVTTCIGLGLATGVWWGLVTGGGLVGGDTFPYFFPQKLIVAESFSSGEVPLWHPLTGLGYPLLAESQAGVFYPPNQILYRVFDVNTAYNAGVLLHYWLAFVFAWRFVRCQGLSNGAGLFAALIFVYGWFPARISLEWSIIGGVWLPLTLWLTDRLLDEPGPRRFAILTGCLGIHLLAGHFSLAFINQLTIVAYALLRTWLKRPSIKQQSSFWRAPAITVLAIGMSLGTAAIQLVPTYELKSTSQRAAGEGKAFDPAYGHMPPLYVTQLFASWWYWHSPEVVRSRGMMKTPGMLDADTNPVEPHLYWGLIPLALCLCSLSRRCRQRLDQQVYLTWMLLTAGGLVYATGWLIPVTRHLPGFGFFIGPGRYTIISALGGAVIAGLVLDAMTTRSSQTRVRLLVLGLAALTLPDLLKSSESVADAVVVSESPLAKTDKSWIRKMLTNGGPLQHRLLAPGPNVGNLFGVSSVPQYLGLGPAVYFDRAFRPPTGPETPDEVFPSPDSVEQLSALGVTHILATEPFRRPSASIRLVQDYPDALLNAVWARGGQSCYLYEFVDHHERVIGVPRNALTTFEVLNASPNSVELRVDLTEKADVVLRELMYPGWNVSIDTEPAVPNHDTSLSMRSVTVPAGQHFLQWTFQPLSFQIGKWISIVSWGMLLVIALRHVRQRQE